MESTSTGAARLAATVAMGLAMTLLAGCRADPVAGTDRPEGAPAPRQVRVSPAQRGTLPRVVTVNGTLAAEEQVALALKVAGRLRELTVDLGSQARRGQVLARLVPTDFQLRVQQAEALLQQARSRLGLTPEAEDAPIDPEKTPLIKQARAVLDEARLSRDRASRLFDEKLISRADLDSAEAAYLVAEGRYQDAREEILARQGLLAQRRSELDLARQQLTDSTLTAPFDGAIRERHATPGEFIAAGQPILTLVRVDPLRLKLSIPERESQGLREGQEVRLTVEGDERPHRGTIARLSPAIQESSRTLMLEAEVPNERGELRPGSFATATIVTASETPVLFVPVSAIVTFAGIEKVILVKEGVTVEKRVRTGRRAEARVEILDGVQEGDQVVVEPGDITAGQAVTVSG